MLIQLDLYLIVIGLAMKDKNKQLIKPAPLQQPIGPHHNLMILQVIST